MFYNPNTFVVLLPGRLPYCPLKSCNSFGLSSNPRFMSSDVYKRQILYGGSCKPSNAKELFANPDVDGGLIGGACLLYTSRCV